MSSWLPDTPQTAGDLYGLLEKRKQELLVQADTAITLHLFQLLNGLINWSNSLKEVDLSASFGQMIPALLNGASAEEFLTQYPEFAEIPVEGFLTYIQTETGVNVLSALLQLQRPLPQQPSETVGAVEVVEARDTEDEPEAAPLEAAPAAADLPPDVEAKVEDIDRLIEVNKNELGPQATIMSSSKMVTLFKSYQYAQNFIDTYLLEHKVFEIDPEMLSDDERREYLRSGIRHNAHLYDLGLCRDILATALQRNLLHSDKLINAEKVEFHRVNKSKPEGEGEQTVKKASRRQAGRAPELAPEEIARIDGVIELWLNYGRNIQFFNKRKYIALVHLFQFYKFPEDPEFDISVRVERLLNQTGVEDKVKRGEEIGIESPVQDNRYINIIYAKKIVTKLLKHNELDLPQLEESNQVILNHFEKISSGGLENYPWLVEWLFSPEVVVHIKNDVYVQWTPIAHIISGDYHYKKDRLDELILEWMRRNPENKLRVRSESGGLSSQMQLPLEMAVFVIRAMSVDPRLGLKQPHD